MCIVLDFEKPTALRLLAVGALFKRIKALAHDMQGSDNWQDEELSISVVSLCVDDLQGMRHLAPYGMILDFGVKATAVPALQFHPGEMSASSVAPILASGKHVVVIGDIGRHSSSKALATEVGHAYLRVDKTTKLNQLSHLLDKTKPDRGTLVFIQNRAFPCPLPFRNVGLVFSSLGNGPFYHPGFGRMFRSTLSAPESGSGMSSTGTPE